jgi:hypothetical protein
MTDLPPRSPLGTERRPQADMRSSQPSLWIVLVVLAVVVVGVIAFTVDRSTGDDEPAAIPPATTVPDAGEATGTTPAPAETNAAPGTDIAPAPDAAPGTDGGTGSADPAAPLPDATNDGTAPANP